MKLIQRLNCVYCDEKSFTHAHRTFKIPIYQGAVEIDADDQDIFESQDWVKCDKCLTLQLIKLVPSDLLYSKGHAESYGKFWADHHHKFSNFILSNASGGFFEVGGGAGRLASLALTNPKVTKWINLDPTSIKQTIVDDRYIFFKENYGLVKSLHKECQNIVFSHSLEHVDSLVKAISCINLSDHEKVFISWPNISEWIKSSNPGALNWEHTFLVSNTRLEELFDNYGFKLIKSIGYEKHSTFMYFKKSNGIHKKNKPIQIYDHEILLKKYFKRFESDALKLNMYAMNCNRNLYLMPASVYSQYLFASGVDERWFLGLLDNSRDKVGKRLFGGKLRILSPSQIGDQDCTVIVNSEQHFQEIKKDLSISIPNANVVRLSSL
jgi:hypothetical protein